ILLVDYENVSKLDLSSVPPDVKVPFFFGASQRTVTKQFFKSALKLAGRFIPIDIEGPGKNALDFHIAFYLAEYHAANPAAARLDVETIINGLEAQGKIVIDHNRVTYHF